MWGMILFWCAGLHVAEVAHDFQQQVRRYITEELHLLNSYDTWHGEVACMWRHVLFILNFFGVNHRDKERGQRSGKSDEGQWNWHHQTATDGQAWVFMHNYDIISMCHMPSHCRSQHKAAPILVHEELFWFSRCPPIQHREHQQALPGILIAHLYFHDICVAII